MCNTYGEFVLISQPTEMLECSHKEADTRLMLHAYHAFHSCYHKFLIRTIDTCTDVFQCVSGIQSAISSSSSSSALVYKDDERPLAFLPLLRLACPAVTYYFLDVVTPTSNRSIFTKYPHNILAWMKSGLHLALGSPFDTSRCTQLPNTCSGTTKKQGSPDVPLNHWMRVSTNHFNELEIHCFNANNPPK